MQRVVVGQKLCPWADEAVRAGHLAVVTLEEEKEDQVAAGVLTHGQLLAKQQGPATTLLVAPKCTELLDFEAGEAKIARFRRGFACGEVYLEVVGWLEEAFQELNLTGQASGLSGLFVGLRFAGAVGHVPPGFRLRGLGGRP